jgi:hypothetical protein
MSKEHSITSRVEKLEQQMEELTPLVHRLAEGMAQQAKRFGRMEDGMNKLSEWASGFAQEMREQREETQALSDLVTQWILGQSKPKGDGEAQEEGES